MYKRQGKTTVVRKIIESLPVGEVVLLPQDSYYKDSSHVPVEERQNINFDHPDAFEWSLLSKHVMMLKEGKSIEQPTYSYLTCTRQPETIHIEPREVVIIEGILALCDKKLRNMMDLKIFVDADPDERLIRVIQRLSLIHIYFLSRWLLQPPHWLQSSLPDETRYVSYVQYVSATGEPPFYTSHAPRDVYKRQILK